MLYLLLFIQFLFSLLGQISERRNLIDSADDHCLFVGLFVSGHVIGYQVPGDGLLLCQMLILVQSDVRSEVEPLAG